jgi:hypothetical protein
MTQACEIVTLDRQFAAVLKAEIPMAEIPATERALVPRLLAALPGMDVAPLGRGFTRWRMAAPGVMDLQPGVFVARAFEPVGEIACVELPAGRAAHFKLVGGYEGMGPAWGVLLAWCKGEGLTAVDFNWQVYGDQSAAPADLVTDLYVPLA